MNLEELRERDKLIYFLPLAGEDEWWMSTETLRDLLKSAGYPRTMQSIHQSLVNYRKKGIVEQLREASPARPGRSRYFLDYEGARWRLRQPEAEQEHQEQDQLSTEAHQLLDLTIMGEFRWLVARLTGLTQTEVKLAWREIRQALGREV